MLKNLYRPYYTKCPKCQESQRSYYDLGYFVCRYCAYRENRFHEETRSERRIKEFIEKMVEFLLPNRPLIQWGEPTLKFPLSAWNGNYLCAGWYSWPPIDIINIPRKTLLLPRKEIVDSTGHESAHVPTWEQEKNDVHKPDPGHGDYWRPVYLDFRSRLLDEFSYFIEAPSGVKPRFTKGYRNKGGIYPSKGKKRGAYKSYWEAEYSLEADEDMKFTGDYFDPYED